MAPTMVSLPAEILQAISTILDIAHPGSLVAFALTSKRCYANATTVLYRTVKIAIADGKQRPYFQDLRDLEKRLLRDDAFAHVRRVILCTSPDRSAANPYTYRLIDHCEKYSEDDTGLSSSWNGCLDGWRSPYACVPDKGWGPAIRLIQQLTGLLDLVWACPEQLPLRLLQVLEEKSQPRLCRLYHYTCCLVRGSPTQSPLTSYKRALVASPCLFSVGHLDQGTRAAGLRFTTLRHVQLPSLRRAYLWLSSDTPEWDGSDRDSDDTDLDDTDRAEPPQVPLEVLHVDAHTLSSSIPFSMVRRESFGDLSSLRVLILNTALAPEGLPAPSDFPSLVTLSLTCDTDEGVPTQYWDDLATLLQDLPHLSTLYLQDWNRDVPIIPCLGPNLRSLDMETQLYAPGCVCWGEDCINQLADACPNLEHLGIAVRRSRGDAAEVARYRSLGRLARLQDLRLCLDASPPRYIETDGGSDTAIETWFDNQDAKYLWESLRPYREGHVRDVLLNSAIDEALARSIFRVIDDAKQQAPGHARPLPLKRLSVHADRGADLLWGARSNSAFKPWKSLLSAFHLHWAVERDVRDDAHEVLHVLKSREDRRGYDKPRSDFAEKYAYWFNLWQRVWPVEDDSVNWWEDWESLPLALGVVGSTDTG